MRTRFTWMAGVAALISVGLLVACSAKFTASNNGLVVVSTQGNAVMDTFSLNLGNGHMTQLFNVNGPPTNGQPTGVVLDPVGAFAYVMVAQSVDVNNSATGIQSFPVASDGKLGMGTTFVLNPAIFTPPGTNVAESVPVSPAAMALDSAGKFLFVADASTGDASGNHVPGAVSVLAVNNGTLTEVTGSPFILPGQPGGTVPSASALAVTPTVYPPAFAVCSANLAPTTEDLYVTDSAGYEVLNYSVSSAGALAFVSQNPTGTVPSGVTVDPCNRFVYVSNAQSNNVSAYTICFVVSLPTCPNGNYSLLPVASPQATPTGSNTFAAENGPGPLMMDAFANYLYVLNTLANDISSFKVSTTTGSLTPLTPTPVATNSFPASMAIRSDDSWLFVTNINSQNLSEYAITPSTGQLTPQAPVQTDNNPWGVAVK